MFTKCDLGKTDYATKKKQKCHQDNNEDERDSSLDKKIDPNESSLVPQF